MYAKYFGLAELPFRITPDPRFLWYSPQHQEAKQKILYHVMQSAGPLYLLADIGTGKTTLAKRIVEDYHGGKITLKDSSPKGTTFRIILDAAEPPREIPTGTTQTENVEA